MELPLYNPYTVGPNNSARFPDWQFARTTEAVYGRSVPLSQSAELRKSGFIPVTRPLRTQCLAVLAATLVFLGMFWPTFWLKTRGGVGRAWLIGICLFVPFICDLFTADQVRESGPPSQTLTAHLAAILPQSWTASIAIAALLLGSLYLAVGKQFRRVDPIGDLRPAEGTE